MSGPSLRQRTISGIGWTVGARLVTQALQFAINVALARMLVPEEFGLVAMILVFTGFLSFFVDAGFGAAIVQREHVEERHLSSVFWLNLGLGVLLTLLVVLGAPLVARFYDEPRLRPLTSFVALNFVVLSFKVVQLGVLRRAMDFRLLTLVEMASVLAGGVVGVLLAWAGFGAWSLVWQTLSISVVSAAMLWVKSDWKPAWRFERRAVRELVGYSGNLTGAELCNYWVTQTDNLLVGKFVGSASLGHYRLAYSMMLLPFQQVSGVIGQVMFPALSRIQRDAELVRDVFLRANRVIGLVTIPMMCGLFVVADSFVLALFGPAWEPVTPILRILCLVGVKQPVGSTTSWLFLSRGRTNLQFRWSLVSGAVSVVAFAIGVRWGVLGVAWAFAIRSWLLAYHAVSIPGALVGLSFGAWAKNLGGVSACALAMAALVAGLDALLPAGWPAGLTLAVLVAAGVALYAALVVGLRVEAWRDARDLVLEQWRERRAARTSA